MQSKSDQDRLVKVIIIGDSGVGKTNVLHRFVTNEFKDYYDVTLGIDFKIKTIKVDDKVIKMQIWDTAGAAGIILTYSIDDRASFDHINNWMTEIQEISEKDVIKYMIATKCDAQRLVDKSEGINLAQQYGIPFAEVSAKDGTGIEQLFYDLGSKIIRQDIQNNKESASKAILKKPGESQVKKPQQLNQTTNQKDVFVNEKNQSGCCKC